jgi:endonuclease/exonuclease/phosphatase (EEP) superfamily protein YafD
MLVVQCSVSVGRLNTVVIYRPPKSTEFFSELDNLLEELVTLPGHLLICGDFNSRSNNNNVDIAVQLKTSLIEHDLLQHITSPTHRLGGLLDLFITPVDQSSLVKDIDIRDMGFSDHFLIIASLNVHDRVCALL